MLKVSTMTKEQKAKEEKRKENSFTGLAASRNNEATLRYARSTIVTVINLGAFSFLGTQLSNPIPILYFILGLIGMSSCVFWLIINKKAQNRIDYWNNRLARLEPPETEPSEFRIFTGEGWRKFNKWPTFQSFFDLVPITFLTLWIVVLGVSFVIERKQLEERVPITLFQFQFKIFNKNNTLKGD